LVARVDGRLRPECLEWVRPAIAGRSRRVTQGPLVPTDWTSMKCESCGAVLGSEGLFCSQCGTQAPDPPREPHASTAEVAALRGRIDELEGRMERHMKESELAWQRIPPLEDSERRHRRILNSSSLYTDMFGTRLVTMVGYGLLSGVVVSAILLLIAFAAGVLRF
jgi:hypothetical protein